MFLRVSLDTGEELEFLMALPPELSHYQVLPNTYTASGEWGQLIFQSFIAKGFSVWYSGCQVKQPIHLHVGAPFETRRFHIVVKNTLDMKPGGLDWLRLKEGQFNITYLPEIDLQLYFEPGDYASFHIHYSADYLQRFTPQLPALGAFLDNTGKGTPCHLCPSHLYASPDMLAAIKSILQNKYIGDLGRIYMESAVITLMAHTIHVIQHENGRSFILTAADKRRMEQVRDWLLLNMDNPGDLQRISRQFLTNEYRLKRDFKEVFGTTVFDFLLQIRMQKAEQLLRDTDMPITDIAYAVGYSNGAHFSDAFKKRYGYSPNYLRKNRLPDN